MEKNIPMRAKKGVSFFSKMLQKIPNSRKQIQVDTCTLVLRHFDCRLVLGGEKLPFCKRKIVPPKNESEKKARNKAPTDLTYLTYPIPYFLQLKRGELLQTKGDSSYSWIVVAVLLKQGRAQSRDNFGALSKFS